MKTITVELLNEKALALLRQLEQLKILRLVSTKAQRNIPKEQNLGLQFERLFEEWKSETLLSSNGSEITGHPIYERIIEMGEPVVPFILIKLKEDPHHLFYALYKITGENPVRSENVGNLSQMAMDWLQWGVQKGYLS